MKATCIIGSPNRNGSTSFLVDRINQGMNSQGIETKCHYLNDMNINYCRGCKNCEETRECVQSDDMNLLIDEIMESDIIQLASPSYWGDVTGQMKVFIDRSVPLCNAKTGLTPVQKGKLGISVALRAGPSKDENHHIISTFEHYFGHLDIKPVSQISVESVDSLDDLLTHQDKLTEAFDLGRNIRNIGIVQK